MPKGLVWKKKKTLGNPCINCIVTSCCTQKCDDYFNKFGLELWDFKMSFDEIHTVSKDRFDSLTKMMGNLQIDYQNNMMDIFKETEVRTSNEITQKMKETYNELRRTSREYGPHITF